MSTSSDWTIFCEPNGSNQAKNTSCPISRLHVARLWPLCEQQNPGSHDDRPLSQRILIDMRIICINELQERQEETGRDHWLSSSIITRKFDVQWRRFRLCRIVDGCEDNIDYDFPRGFELVPQLTYWDKNYFKSTYFHAVLLGAHVFCQALLREE